MNAVGALPRAVWAVSRKKLNTSPPCATTATPAIACPDRPIDRRCCGCTRCPQQSLYDLHLTCERRRLGLRDDRGDPGRARAAVRTLERRRPLPAGQRDAALQRALLRGRRDLQEDPHPDAARPPARRARRPPCLSRRPCPRGVLADPARLEPDRPADVALRVGGERDARRQGRSRGRGPLTVTQPEGPP